MTCYIRNKGFNYLRRIYLKKLGEEGIT